MKRNNFLKILTILVAVISLNSCNSNTSDKYTVKDSLDNNIYFENTPERVVILEASLAEIYTLSGGFYVGISDDYETYGLELNNATIVGSAHYPNLETIVSLNPDLVIYSTKKSSQVDICSQIYNLGIQTYACTIESFDDYLYTLRQFTTLTNREDLYKVNGLDILDQINAVKNKVDSSYHPKVLFLRAMSNKYSIIGKDNFVCDILNDLGTINIASTSYISDDVSTEIIVRENPDFIFYTFMGSNDIEKSQKYLEENLFNKGFFKELDAVKNEQVYYLDTSLYHYKPNNKWGLAYERLYQIIYK